jgi:hypothetical protein
MEPPPCDRGNVTTEEVTDVGGLHLQWTYHLCGRGNVPETSTTSGRTLGAFNGATALRPWKWASASPSVSMSPPLQWSHRLATVEGHMTKLPLKIPLDGLQWSHSRLTVETQAKNLGCLIKMPLRWSHGFATVEKTLLRPTTRQNINCFNGATVLRPWNCVRTIAGPSVTMWLQWSHHLSTVEIVASGVQVNLSRPYLQWSHCPAAVEMLRIRPAGNQGRGTSMEPPSCDRGNGGPAARPGRGRVPSMEPPPFDCGNGPTHVFQIANNYYLQWSHRLDRGNARPCHLRSTRYTPSMEPLP